MAIIEDKNKLDILIKMITLEEQNIEKFYYDLGKAHFEIHSDDAESELQPQISGIKSSKAKIADFTQQIKELKGIIACKGCGADVYKTAAFCTVCGTRIAPEPVPAPAPVQLTGTKCVNCGGIVPEGSAFCTTCGTKAEAPAPAPAPNVAFRCTNCGANVPAGSAFCTVCGTKVGAPAPAPAEVPKCANCGAPIPEGSAFCVACGTRVGVSASVSVPTPEPAPIPAPIPEPVPAPAPVEAPKCVNCGADIPERSAFCIVCGTRVGAAPVAEVKEEPQVPAPNLYKYCSKEIAEGAKFCIYCGKKQ